MVLRARWLVVKEESTRIPPRAVLAPLDRSRPKDLRTDGSQPLSLVRSSVAQMVKTQEHRHTHSRTPLLPTEVSDKPVGLLRPGQL